MTEQAAPVNLPSRALKLWRRVRPGLEDTLREVLNNERRWYLGGGTVLAADWRNHRRSNDIDLKVEPRKDEDWTNAGLLHLEQRMEELGADRILRGKRQLIVQFGDQALDIFRAKPALPGSEETRPVDGRAEIVLSHGQILHGKIHGRGLHSPTRDLYDIAVARRIDRDTLEAVVNCMSHRALEEIAERWEALTRYHQRQAEKRLQDVPARFEEIKTDPAAHAVEAVLDTRYRESELAWNRGSIELKSICNDGHTSVHRTDVPTDGDVQAILRSSGISDYIRQNTISSIASITETIERARTKARGSYWTIWTNGRETLTGSPWTGANDQDRTRKPTRETDDGYSR